MLICNLLISTWTSWKTWSSFIAKCSPECGSGTRIRCGPECHRGNVARGSSRMSSCSRRMTAIKFFPVLQRAFVLLLVLCEAPCSQVAAYKEGSASESEENYIGSHSNQGTDGENRQCNQPKFVSVTDETFEDYDDGFLLLLYYADWSGNSKKFLPFWSSLAEELDDAGLSVAVGLIDSSENRRNTASKYVHTVPAIFLFHEGDIVAQFVNERSFEELKIAVTRLLGLSDAALADRKRKVLKQLEEAESERLYKAQEEETQEALTALKFETHVTTLHKDNFYALTSKTDAVAFIYTPWCEHCKVMKADWLELAKDPQIPGILVAKINFDDFSTFPGAGLLEGVPTILFFRNSALYGYFNASRALDDIRTWANVLTSLTLKELQDLLGGLKQEEARRESQGKQELAYEKALVNEEFGDILELSNDNIEGLTRGKSALILFYTEKGERSQLMKPVWVALSKLKDLTGLLIARFPETDNRRGAQREYIHGYPTVLFSKNGVIIDRYEGVQKLDELYHYAKSLIGLSTEEARDKHAHLARTMQREKLMEREKERLRYKAEQKRREEESRKERQQRRKKKPRP